MSRSEFVDCEIEQAFFNEVEAVAVEITQSTMYHSYVVGCNWEESRFNGAIVLDTYFEDANLRGSIFEGTLAVMNRFERVQVFGSLLYGVSLVPVPSVHGFYFDFFIENLLDVFGDWEVKIGDVVRPQHWPSEELGWRSGLEASWREWQHEIGYVRPLSVAPGKRVESPRLA